MLILFLIGIFPLFVLFLRVVLFFRRCNKLSHAEDLFHKEYDIEKNKKHRIYATEIFHNMTDLEFKSYAKITSKKLIEYHRKYFGDFITKLKDEDIVAIRDDFDDKWKDTDIVSSYFYLKDKKLVSTFNHTYAGGYHFILYMQIYSNGLKLPKIPSRPTFPGLAEYYALQCFIRRPDITNAKPLLQYNKDDDMQRIYFNFRTNKIPNISSKVTILYNVLEKMMLGLPKLNRKVRVLIPMTFKPEKNIFNNVSAVILEYPQKGMTINELDKQLSKLVYQVVGGNYIAQFNCVKSKNVKSMVDIVITMGYVNDVKYNPVTLCTYNGIADYSLYCVIGTFDGVNHVTLTSSSPEIDLDKIKKAEDGDYFDMETMQLIC